MSVAYASQEPAEPGIDKKILFDMLGYKPHKGQQLVHDSTAKYRVPTCGRRWGKSQVAGHEFTAAMFIPDTRWWIVGPTYALAEKEFRVVHDDLFLNLGKKHPSLIQKCKKQYNVNQGNMRIEMPWNTILEAKSAEKKDGLVGEGLDGIIFSEAALHSADTWNMYLQPALTDKDGWAIFPSTPRGYNWYYGLWRLGQEVAGYESWRFPSWENPYVFPQGREDPKLKEIENVVSEYHFQQEYGAEFTAFEGKIYNEFNPTVHVKDISYNPLWRNYWAFDYGFAAPFVCLDIMVDPMDNVYVWREYQQRYKSTYEQGIQLRARPNPQGFHVDGRMGDPRGADENATLALQLGGIVARPVPWIQGIESVKRWLKLQPDGKPKLFIDRSCTELIRQLEQLRVPNERENKNVREGQHDYDDHGPDALRYFFNEFFVLGMGSSLSDVYSGRQKAADTFFQFHSDFTVEGNSGIPFG